MRTEGRGYETTDATAKPAIVVAALLVLSVVIGAGVSWWMFQYFDSQMRGESAALSPLADRELPPEPVIQVSPRAHHAAFAAEQEAQISTYGWVSRPAGQVRIPVERAMDLLFERGLPTRGSVQNVDPVSELPPRGSR